MSAVNWFKYSSPASFLLSRRQNDSAVFCRLLVLFSAWLGLYIGFFVAPTIFSKARLIGSFSSTCLPRGCECSLRRNGGMGGIRLGVQYPRLPSVRDVLRPHRRDVHVPRSWTGAFWGKPTWGTWWVWDARLTSDLILLFLYIGFMSLQAAIDDPRRADNAGAVIALVGVVNVPIIYFSVRWWNALGALLSVFRNAPKRIHAHRHC